VEPGPVKPCGTPRNVPLLAKRRAAKNRDDAERRRQSLVGAAERVFLKKGYHAATMDDIAVCAGMSKRTLYQLVESKAKLFLLLLDRHRPHVAVTIDYSGAAPDAMLFEILSPWARQILTPPNVSVLRLIIADYQRGKTLARLLDRCSAQLCKDTLEKYLAELVATQKLALDDPKEAAHMLFGMAIGNIHFGMLIGLRGAPSREELEARLRRAIGIFLGGALPPI
jgi:TetR/AcrR family transcriptional repressor of mexJK operon